MMTLLLMIIFTSFISLGLPDSLLGAAWPVMHLDLGVPLANAGSLSMVISGGSILSSLFSGKLIARFGTGKLTLISVLMTAVALFGFYSLLSFFWLVIAAIPLGLGGGAVDAGLNNFVALHYRAQYMNWLHCFWGVGATIGPIILAYFIGQNNQWRKGFLAISIIQFILVVILFLSLPLWKKVETDLLESQPESKKNESKNLFKVKGIFPALISFFSYSAVETTAHV
ncbi:MFS transporter [Carnobacterium sp. CS13]|uniref:MFS transporter n=1 Tax=Carnobacterium sp. CS13 TaxID=2800128 RepID=UPI00191332A2|nr:MFS transporter [Carnobacterium sp. CS13]QQP69912.1 MFS transporter [Carnobacterium sp. CS13]